MVFMNHLLSVREFNYPSKAEVKNTHWLEQAKDGGHPAKGVQPRLKPVKVAALTEQADAITPGLELLAAPEASA